MIRNFLHADEEDKCFNGLDGTEKEEHESHAPIECGPSNTKKVN